MKIEVFNYTWTSTEGNKEETGISPHKVTKEYYEDRKRCDIGMDYQIIEESKDLVDSILIIDGSYHPEFRSNR
jgi:hypothetical protein